MRNLNHYSFYMTTAERSIGIPTRRDKPDKTVKPVKEFISRAKTLLSSKVDEIKSEITSGGREPLEIITLTRHEIENLSYKDKLFLQQVEKTIRDPKNFGKKIFPAEIKHWKAK